MRDASKTCKRCDRGCVERILDKNNTDTHDHKLFLDTYLTPPPMYSTPQSPLPRRRFPFPLRLLRGRFIRSRLPRARLLRGFLQESEQAKIGDRWDGCGVLRGVCAFSCARSALPSHGVIRSQKLCTNGADRRGRVCHPQDNHLFGTAAGLPWPSPTVRGG